METSSKIKFIHQILGNSGLLERSGSVLYSGGQTIMRCHIHLIPRRSGDMEDPRGGVRGVIPGKQSY